MIQTGDAIGPYTLVRTLGRGGEVWLAEREVADRLIGMLSTQLSRGHQGVCVRVRRVSRYRLVYHPGERLQKLVRVCLSPARWRSQGGSGVAVNLNAAH